MDQKRYPVGKFQHTNDWTEAQIADSIAIIEEFPGKLRAIVQPLAPLHLESRYRAGGWTIRQLVHHVVDSHLNSYIRFKWVLTEDHPTIKTYDQVKWSELPDGKEGPVEMSLDFLEGLHRRWVYLLRSIQPHQWERTFVHPEMQRTFDLYWLLGLYAWHCRHHLAHVELAIHAPASDLEQ